MNTNPYKEAGVDVEAGYEAVRLMKRHVGRTLNEHVLGSLGSFGGFYSLEGETMQKPVLVAGTDGVGTKLKLAFMLDRHDTVGIDCVAMCANDVVCQGAKPLFFLDYLATGSLSPKRAEAIVKGVADGCVQAGCALIGGETAEMPGFYPEGEYDLAGFCVGIVDRDSAISGAAVREGDTIIGLASSGVHSNGFSLIRKLLLTPGVDLNAVEPSLGLPLGDVLLTPTRIYVQTILTLARQHTLRGIAHITGGGFIENIPRMLPEGLGAVIDTGAYEVPAIFRLLAQKGQIGQRAMYNTFNMGIGMTLAVAQDDADDVLRAAEALGETAYRIGRVAKQPNPDRLVLE